MSGLPKDSKYHNHVITPYEDLDLDKRLEEEDDDWWTAQFNRAHCFANPGASYALPAGVKYVRDDTCQKRSTASVEQPREKLPECSSNLFNSGTVFSAVEIEVYRVLFEGEPDIDEFGYEDELW